MADGDTNPAPTGGPDIPFAPLSQTNTAQPPGADLMSALSPLGLGQLARGFQQGMNPPPPPVRLPFARAPSVAAWRSPYQRAGVRDFGQLGRDNWWTRAAMNYPGQEIGPMLPSPMEALSVIAGAGNQLSQVASPGVAGPAGRASSMAMQISPQLRMVLDWASKGAFTRNQLAAQMGNLRMREIEMNMANEQALQEHAKQLMELDGIINIYNEHGYSKDDAQNADIAHHELEKALIATGHQKLLGVLANSGIPAVKNWLKEEDRLFQDLYAGHTSSTKSSKNDGQDPYVEGGGGGGGGIRDLPDPSVTPPRVAATERTPATAAPPTPAGGGSMDAALRSKYGLTEEGMGLAHAGAQGRDISEAQKQYKEGGGKADAARQDMENAITGITTNRALSPEEKLSEIDKIDPTIADRLRSLRAYHSDPNQFHGQKGQERYLNWMSSLDPNYKEGFFGIAKKYTDPNTQEGRVLLRADTLADHALAVLDALKDISETESIPRRYLDKWLATYDSGDPRFDKLFSAIRNMATETISVQTGTGVPRVQLVKELLRYMGPTGSPASIRAQTTIDLGGAYSLLHNTTDEWNRMTGQPGSSVPQYSPRAGRVIEAILRGNTVTGQMPTGPDEPEEVLAVSKSGKARPSWVRPDQVHAPLNREEARQARELLAKYRNDPTARAKLEEIRRRLGIWAIRGPIE